MSKDKKMAMKWFEKNIEPGDTDIIYGLATLFNVGLVVPLNFTKAVFSTVKPPNVDKNNSWINEPPSIGLPKLSNYFIMKTMWCNA